jgi:hypothetical protein
MGFVVFNFNSKKNYRELSRIVRKYIQVKGTKNGWKTWLDEFGDLVGV